ncbi:unnamed protein product [Alopecurus aequalis]
MAKGSRGGGGARGGGSRGRGPPSANNDVQRVAATVTDAATRVGFQATGSGTGRLPPDMVKFLLACWDGDVDRIKVFTVCFNIVGALFLPSLFLGYFDLVLRINRWWKLKWRSASTWWLSLHVSDSDPTCITPLACAAAHGQLIAARYLLDKGANPNKKRSFGRTTPLHEAAEAGHDEIAQLLLSKGASVDSPSSYGSPLVAAGVRGKFSVMKILLENHADPNKVSWMFGPPLNSTLYGAPERMSESTCLKCVKLLVEAGADVNCTNPEAPLAIATSKGLTSCVKYLLEVSRNANDPEKHDKSSDKDRKAQLKSQGAKAVEGKNYVTALKFYTEAIRLDPADAVLYSNRSLCHLKCDEAHEALLDADTCISLRPEWQKGYYRKGSALMSLLEYKEATDAFLAGAKLNPENKEMQEAFREAVDAMRK